MNQDLTDGITAVDIDQVFPCFRTEPDWSDNALAYEEPMPVNTLVMKSLFQLKLWEDVTPSATTPKRLDREKATDHFC